MGVLRAAARLACCSMLCLFTALAGANGQSPPSNLKEVQIAEGAFSLGDPIPSWVETVAIPQAQEAKPVIMRLADTQWLVGDTPVVHVHRAVMINDAASLTSGGQLAIPFDPQYQKLQLHDIHVLRADKTEDRTASSTIRFLQRETGLEQGVYNGIVTVSVLVNDLRVGDTIEFSYTLHGQNPAFGGKFVGSAVWDQGYPTLLRRAVLNYPATRKINWRLIDDTKAKAIAPVESIHDGMRRLYFEEKSIPEITIDRNAPPDYSPFRVLQLSEFSGWDDVVSWASDLFRASDAPDEELQKVVGKLREVPGTEQRIAAALEFVQSEIRYFSVSLGESSHRPTAPNVVLQRRYGDCKDKSLLLITLLKELGVQSEPVLLDAGQRKSLDKYLPSPQVFDHAIVRVDVDAKSFYLDPTRLGQHGRLDRMGQVHEGAEVLVIAPETRRLSPIASPNVSDAPRSLRSETATLPKLGPDGSLQVRQTWTGVGAETIRVMRDHLAAAQFDKLIGSDLEARYPSAKLAGELQVDDDRDNNVLSITAGYDVPGLATERDGNWIVRFFPGNLRGSFAPSASSDRTAPLAMPIFPFRARYTFEVKFPDQVSSIADPASGSVLAKQFSYTVTTSFRGNLFKTSIDLKTLADRVEMADLSKYRDDLKKVENLTRGFVLVTKDQIKPSVASDGKSFAQHLRTVMQQKIDKYTKAINSGKLAGKDLASAYCERSDGYDSLDKTADAMRDVNEAVKLAPDNAHMFSCRGEVYFRRGEFDKSIADYSTAIGLDASDAEFFRGRGVSAYYAGRLDSAAEDFAKAADIAEKEPRAYIDLWFAWTLLRLGKPMPETLAGRVTDAHGDWPRPALAMLAGNITPEDMLATLDAKSGDDRQMALAEGYFYLAQHYLVAGDTAKARMYFEKTRQQGVIFYYEHIAAGFELKRLVEANAKSHQGAATRSSAGN